MKQNNGGIKSATNNNHNKKSWYSRAELNNHNKKSWYSCAELNNNHNKKSWYSRAELWGHVMGVAVTSRRAK
jgi:hypothetical protein